MLCNATVNKVVCPMANILILYLFQKIYGAFAYTVKSWYENSKFFRYFKKVINSYLVEMYKTLRAAEILVGAVAGSRAGGDAGLVVPTTLHATI